MAVKTIMYGPGGKAFPDNCLEDALGFLQSTSASIHVSTQNFVLAVRVHVHLGWPADDLEFLLEGPMEAGPFRLDDKGRFQTPLPRGFCDIEVGFYEILLGGDDDTPDGIFAR